MLPSFGSQGMGMMPGMGQSRMYPSPGQMSPGGGGFGAPPQAPMGGVGMVPGVSGSMGLNPGMGGPIQGQQQMGQPMQPYAGGRQMGQQTGPMSPFRSQGGFPGFQGFMQSPQFQSMIQHPLFQNIMSQMHPQQQSMLRQQMPSLMQPMSG